MYIETEALKRKIADKVKDMKAAGEGLYKKYRELAEEIRTIEKVEEIEKREHPEKYAK